MRDAMRAGRIGMMATPAQGNVLPDGATWAADNGVYGAGWPGDDAFRTWLRTRHGRDRCMFATAPDVVADAAATLSRSSPWYTEIRDAGYRVALAAQDGLEDLVVPWGSFDAFFIGGSTEWKLGPAARHLVAEAKLRGKWVHMGRVNSLRRVRYAAAIGCDSVDGTYLAFGPDRNLPRLLGWMHEVSSQPPLFDIRECPS